MVRGLHLGRYYKNYDSSKVMQLKNIHKYPRCFLVGTGPSLNKTPLHLLEKEIIFGTNTLYKLLHKLDILPLYYCVSDGNVWDKHKEGILELDTTLILSGDAGRSYLQNDEQQSKVIVLKDI